MEAAFVTRTIGHASAQIKRLNADEAFLQFSERF